MKPPWVPIDYGIIDSSTNWEIKQNKLTNSSSIV